MKKIQYLYEHLGSESNNLKYPSCEYIINENSEKSYLQYQTNKIFLK